jgi:hypothetical protein
LPAVAWSIVLFTRPEYNFFSLLWYSLALVYGTTGFFFLGLKFWEFWDFKFVIFKRGIWKSSPVMRKVCYKILPAKDSNYNVIDMYPAWNQIRTVLDHTRTKYEKYVLGKWYYDIAFDIIIRNGKPEFYIQFPLKFKDIVFAAFLNNFPGIRLLESEDPYKHWPKKWSPGQKIGPYKDFYATNIGLANSDMYPLRDPASYSAGETPLGNLISKFLELDPQTTIILQYVIRPFGTEGKMPKWEKELNAYKKEVFEKSGSLEVSQKDSTANNLSGELITDVSRRTINAVENKFNESHFRTGFKIFVFYPQGKSYYIKNIEKIFKSYCGQTASDMQIMEKKWRTATNLSFQKLNEGLLDNVVGPIMDRFYYTKHSIYRKKVQYQGLLGRSLDVSWDSGQFFLDSQSISSWLHVPNINFFPDLTGGQDQLHKPATHSEHSGFPRQNFQRLRDLQLRSKMNELLNQDYVTNQANSK